MKNLSSNLSTTINSTVNSKILSIVSDIDKNISLIQCKNGYKKGVKIQDLAGLYSWKTHFPNYDGILYYTDKLSKSITSLPENPKIKYIKQEYSSPRSYGKIQHSALH